MTVGGVDDHDDEIGHHQKDDESMISDQPPASDEDRRTKTTVAGYRCLLPAEDGTDHCVFHDPDRQPTITQTILSTVDIPLGPGQVLRGTLGANPEGFSQSLYLFVLKDGQAVVRTGASPGVPAFCGLREALDGLGAKIPWTRRKPEADTDNPDEAPED